MHMREREIVKQFKNKRFLVFLHSQQHTYTAEIKLEYNFSSHFKKKYWLALSYSLTHSFIHSLTHCVPFSLVPAVVSTISEKICFSIDLRARKWWEMEVVTKEAIKIQFRGVLIVSLITIITHTVKKWYLNKNNVDCVQNRVEISLLLQIYEKLTLS